MIHSLAKGNSRFVALVAKWLAVGCLALPAGWAAESAPVTDPAVFPRDVAVQSMFRKALAFRVAQSASTPISVVHGATFGGFDGVGGGGLTSNTFTTVFSPTSNPNPLPEQVRLLPDVAPNDWGDDFVNGQAPTSLDGVRVMVNGIASPIYFIGRGEDLGTGLDQINFLSPQDNALGPVSIQVFKGEQMVAASMVNRGGVASPGLFAFGARDGVTYVIAVSATGELILPSGYFDPPPFPLPRPTRSGEVIIFFGTGYGATEPPVPAGTIVNVLSQMPPSEANVMIGNMPAVVHFAGLAPGLTGLYQFNIQIPQLSNGDHPVSIGRGGFSSQAGLSIRVQNP
jgi:uncharacterized protein (TIGR03437 family)